MDSTAIDKSPDVRSSPEYLSASSFLVGRLDFERTARMPYSTKDMNLSRMRRLLGLLDNPHEEVKVIHVAGTKGKGSTSALLASAFAAMGLRCGTYTSPHLHRVEERFSINGHDCSPTRFIQLIERIRPAVTKVDREFAGKGPTYFEITTAISFLFFLEEDVDIAVLEVGLGGRLDSTNVCHPLLCIITSISFDHTRQLGNTLTAIANEKAGIIKPGIRVISGATDEEARLAIARVAAERGAPLDQLNADFRYANFQSAKAAEKQPNAWVDFQVRENGAWKTKAAGVAVGLLGEHQAANAAVAWAALQTLPQHLQPGDVAIRGGFEHAKCPARIEVVSRQPLTIVDAAHNVASAQALIAVINDLYRDRQHRSLVLGITRGKDVAGMLRVLLPAFEHVICSRYQNNPRGLDARKLADLATTISAEMAAPCAGRISQAATPNEALALAQGTTNDLICVTGSFFIAAEVRELLLTSSS